MRLTACIMFVESQIESRVETNREESQALQVRVGSESSKNFRVEPELSHDLVNSSQSRITKPSESLRVIGLQPRVNFESDKIKLFTYIFFS